MSRPSRPVVGISAVAVLVLVVIAAGVAGALRPGGSPGAFGAPRFVDETAASGLDHTFDGGDYTFDVGGGVAVFDCDGDGRPDVYASGGAAPAALFRNESSTGGSLRFARTTSPVTDLTDVTGAYPIDIDADGIADLAVLEQGRATVLRGLGGCRFEDAGASLDVSPALPLATAFSATWEGTTTLPTLAFGSYLDPASSDQGDVTCCGDNELVRPDASGTRYAPPAPLSPGYCALSMLFSDWDGSGRRDLRVSNDRQYYDNAVGERAAVARRAGRGAACSTRPPTAGGCCSCGAWGSRATTSPATGYPEVYLTSQGDNKLQTLAAGPVAAGLPRHRPQATGSMRTRPAVGGDPLPSTAWHPEFQDVNNDGLDGPVRVQGQRRRDPRLREARPEQPVPRPARRDVRRGRRRQAGIVSFDRGRGAALADFNQDGLLDLVEVNLGAPVRVWRNVGGGYGGCAGADGRLARAPAAPAGRQPRRDRRGGRDEGRRRGASRRELVVGGGHIGGQLGWTHVGLGPATEAQVRVTWPDGEVGPWMTVARGPVRRHRARRDRRPSRGRRPAR